MTELQCPNLGPNDVSESRTMLVSDAAGNNIDNNQGIFKETMGQTNGSKKLAHNNKNKLTDKQHRALMKLILHENY